MEHLCMLEPWRSQSQLLQCLLPLTPPGPEIHSHGATFFELCPNQIVYSSLSSFLSLSVMKTSVHIIYPMTFWPFGHVQILFNCQDSMVAANWIAATKWRSLPWLTAERGTTERWRVAERRAWLVLDIILPQRSNLQVTATIFGRNVSDRINLLQLHTQHISILTLQPSCCAGPVQLAA